MRGETAFGAFLVCYLFILTSSVPSTNSGRTTPTTEVMTGVVSGTSPIDAGAVAGGLVGGVVVITICIILFVFYKRRFAPLARLDKLQAPDVIGDQSASQESFRLPGKVLYQNAHPMNELCHQESESGQPVDTEIYLPASDKDGMGEFYTQTDIDQTVSISSQINPLHGDEVRELYTQVNKAVEKNIHVDMNLSTGTINVLYTQVNKKGQTSKGQPLSSIADDVSHGDYDHVHGESSQFSVIEQDSYDHVITNNTANYDEAKIDNVPAITTDHLNSNYTEDDYDKLNRFVSSKPNINREDSYSRLQRLKAAPSTQSEKQCEGNYDYATFSPDK